MHSLFLFACSVERETIKFGWELLGIRLLRSTQSFILLLWVAPQFLNRTKLRQINSEGQKRLASNEPYWILSPGQKIPSTNKQASIHWQHFLIFYQRMIFKKYYQYEIFFKNKRGAKNQERDFKAQDVSPYQPNKQVDQYWSEVCGKI